jgi:hypothetical protein
VFVPVLEVVRWEDAAPQIAPPTPKVTEVESAPYDDGAPPNYGDDDQSIPF